MDSIVRQPLISEGSDADYQQKERETTVHDDRFTGSRNESGLPVNHRTCDQTELKTQIAPHVQQKTIYQPKESEPLFYGGPHVMTHKALRAIFSEYMSIYAVITDDSGNGANNVLVFGKPKFAVPKMQVQLFCRVVDYIDSIENQNSPFSSDLIGFSITSPNWVVHKACCDWYEKSENGESTDNDPLFNKLDKLYEQYQEEHGSDFESTRDMLNNVTTGEFHSMFKQGLNHDIEKIKGLESTGGVELERQLNQAATKNDLPGIIQSYQKKGWALNYCCDELSGICSHEIVGDFFEKKSVSELYP